MAPVRREAPRRGATLSLVSSRSVQLTGERPADPGKDPRGYRPPAPCPRPPVLEPHHRRATLAAAGRQPRHAAASPRCGNHTTAAPRGRVHAPNLGTLLRTCDAVGACLAVPRLPWVPEALARGNTLRRPACVHWTGRDPCQWLQEQRSAGGRTRGGAPAE